MSKIGKTVLLIVIFLILSGATTHTHAQEKLFTITNISVSQKGTCTALQSILVGMINSCNEAYSPQKDSITKAVSRTNETVVNVFSYSMESAYENPINNISPTPTQPQQTEPLDPTSSPAITPENNIPAEGRPVDADIIFRLINQHRSEIGKPAFQKDEALCQLAKTRSFELHDELFVNGNLHSGLYNRNLPYWITEDAKWGSNEAGTVAWWLHSPIHRQAIEGDYAYSCGACMGSQCSQLFTSYIPKLTKAPVKNNFWQQLPTVEGRTLRV